ncbi:MAG TPA: NADH-quinone oxidoreductase subunit N [Acidimicrobiales bacterium]
MNALLAVVSQPLPAEPEPIVTPHVDWWALGPVLALVGGALLLLLLTSFVRSRLFPGAYALITSIAGLAAIGLAIPLWRRVQDADRGPFSTLEGAIGVDGFSVFATVVIAAGVVLTALLIDGYLRREGLDGIEAYALVLLSAAGGVVMAQANDLIVLFLGLEALSIAVYVLAALHLRRVTSQEAGLKYFVLGSFASAFLLYGIALLYGGTGTTNLGTIMGLFSTSVLENDGLVFAGLALVLVGLGFKVSAVPFHFWTPDVYQGAPSPMVAWMASGVKVAGFAGMIRVFVLGFQAYAVDWQPMVYGLAIATLLVGSVLAVVQTNVKRMLAYSSISHAGYVLIGIQAATDKGVQGALFYLAAYTFMVAGSFGVVTLVGRKGDARHRLEDYRGLGRERPLLALTLTLLLLSQAGVPLTSGFFAKFYVISAAVDAGSVPLAVIGMLAAVIAAFLYLRIIVAMYMADEEASAEGGRLAISPGAGLALALCLVVTIGVGLWPGAISHWAEDAIPVLVASSGA